MICFSEKKEIGTLMGWEPGVPDVWIEVDCDTPGRWEVVGWRRKPEHRGGMTLEQMDAEREAHDIHLFRTKDEAERFAYKLQQDLAKEGAQDA